MSAEGIKVLWAQLFRTHVVCLCLKKVNSFVVNYQIHQGEFNSDKETFDPFSHVFATQTCQKLEHFSVLIYPVNYKSHQTEFDSFYKTFQSLFYMIWT